MKPWKKQCKDKPRYDTETDAKMGIREHVGAHPSFNAYFCPHCEFWHMGHRPRADEIEQAA